MPDFRFKAIDATGKVVKGQSSAQDPANLARILQEQGLFLMESDEAIVVVETPAAAKPKGKGFNRSIKVPLPKRKGQITLKEVSFLTSQLAIMIRSALPILESLELLAAQAANPEMKAVLKDITTAVSEGLPLSQAFARHPKLFDEIYISLLAAGEISGELDEMLDRLSAHLTFQIKLRSSIRSVLAYPAVVVSVSIAVVGFIIVFVLPTFMEVFTQLEIELPLPTRILIMVSEAIRTWWHAMSAAVFAAFLGFKHWLREPDNLRRATRWQLDTPIIGPLTRNIVLTRMLRTMGSLIASGISITKSLEIARSAAGNIIYSDIMEKVAHDVHEGKPMSQSFAESPYIPPVVIGMIATGERTGTLPDIISRVADFYEAETDTSIKDLFSAIEPIFIVGLGVMVGAMAVSVLLPMFDVAQGIK